MQALAVEAVSAQPLQLQQAQGSASAADRGCWIGRRDLGIARA